MSDAPALVRCEGLAVGYGGRPVLPPIDVEIGAGEFWVVLGRNGSGKSTWFRTLLGLQPPVSGKIRWPAGAQRVAYLAQRMSFDDLVPVSVEDVVGMALERRWSFLRPAVQRRDRVEAALDAVSAGDLRGRTFRSLSEGQKQRVLLARMVAVEARLALLDEPTAAMDAVAEQRAMALLDDLRRKLGMSVIVVSHHLASIQKFAEKVLFLDADTGSVVSGTPREVLHHPAFIHRYGELGDA